MKVVIVGAGFAGINAARQLEGAAVDVTVIDRWNHHLFFPLLYQVATAGLSPAEIAVPIRHVLSNQRNAEILMGEVTGVDKTSKRIYMGERSVPYDILILATGSQHSYFGHEEWARYAPGLKSIEDAVTIRHKVLSAFEAAEMEPDPVKRADLMNFVVVGGGPTGVEMAGAIAELAHNALACDFRHINPKMARIFLLEAGPRILASFPEELSDKAMKSLARLCVEVHCGTAVNQIDADGVTVGGRRIASKNVVWAAGVQASPAGRWIDAECDKHGRVRVKPDLSVPGHPEIFVIGDTSSLEQDGKPLPGLAPVAKQQGDYVAALIRQWRSGRVMRDQVKSFRYNDRGAMATIGRSAAVADIKGLKLSGWPAWFAWVVIHVFFLIGFHNRVLVLMQWVWAYFTYQRGARLITTASGQPAAILAQRRTTATSEKRPDVAARA